MPRQGHQPGTREFWAQQALIPGLCASNNLRNFLELNALHGSSH